MAKKNSKIEAGKFKQKKLIDDYFIFLLKTFLQKKWPDIYILLHEFSRGHYQTPKVASNMPRVA